MADTGATGLPSVLPTDTAPDSYIRVTEKVGGAMRDLGAQVSKVGDYFDQAAADDAFNQLQERGKKLFYGGGTSSLGPDGQPVEDTGYLGTKGRAALDGRPVIEKTLDSTIKDISSKLSVTQQRAFMQAASKYKNSMYAQASNHADTQSTAWYASVNQVSEQNALQAIAANPLDATVLASNSADLINARVKQAQLLGAVPGDAAFTEAIQGGKRDALTAQVQALGATDPVRAMDILEKNRTIAGTSFDELYGQLKERADQKIAVEAGDAAWTGARGTADASFTNPNLPIYSQATAGIPSGYSSAGLARVVQIESGGNPGVANASGHVGLGQFSESTAREVGLTDRTDGNASIIATQQYAANNSRVLTKVLGRAPTDAELYLAHQQGPGGASKLLGNPTATAASLIGIDAVKGNLPGSMRGRADTITAAEFTAYWASKFSGSVPTPALAPPEQPVITNGNQSVANPDIFKLTDDSKQSRADMSFGAVETPEGSPLPSAGIQSTTPVDAKASAYQAIEDNPDLTPEQRQRARAYVASLAQSDAIARETTAAAKKQAEDEAVDKYATMMLTGKTDGLLDQIANDPKIGGEKKIALTNAIQADAQRTVAGATAAYGPKFYEALKQINADPSDPARIWSVDQLLKMVQPGPNGEPPAITLAGYQQLGQMLTASQKQPDQAAVNNTQMAMLAVAKKKLSFQREPTSQYDPGVKDPQGEALFATRFLPKFYAAYNDWVTKQGKDPWEFLTEENMNKLAEGLRSPKEMAMAELLTKTTGGSVDDLKAPPAPPNVDEQGWKIAVNTLPVNPQNGKTIAPAKWLGYVQTLATDPTDQNMKYFDEVFAPTGITSADILSVLAVEPTAGDVPVRQGGGPEEAATAAPAADGFATKLLKTQRDAVKAEFDALPDAEKLNLGTWRSRQLKTKLDDLEYKLLVDQNPGVVPEAASPFTQKLNEMK
jgi:hypothetical protein